MRHGSGFSERTTSQHEYTYFNKIPYHTTPHYTPHHTTPHQTTPHHTTPYHTTPYHTIPYHTIPYHTTPHHTTPHHTTPHHTTPHHTTPGTSGAKFGLRRRPHSTTASPRNPKKRFTMENAIRVKHDTITHHTKYFEKNRKVTLTVVPFMCSLAENHDKVMYHGDRHAI